MLGILVVVVAASVIAVQSASAATVPAHNVPPVSCYGTGEIDVDMPKWVTTPYRSEKVWTLFHLFKRVNGIWQHQITGDLYFSNYATYGGALNGGWLPNGDTSQWGVCYDDFFIKTTGDYRVAMEMWWMSSGAYTYEWTDGICSYR